MADVIHFSSVPELKLNGKLSLSLDSDSGPEEEEPPAGSSNQNGFLRQSMDDASKAAYGDKKFSAAEEKLNEAGKSHVLVLQERFSHPGVSNYWELGKSVYENNSDQLSVDVQLVEKQLSGFVEASKVLMKALDGLKSVHPFIGIAVAAFEGVISLEFKRRDNDKKVLALKMQMKDMISVLLQLEGVTDPKQPLPDGTTLEGRMQGTLKQVADDITTCGNLCDSYTKKKLVVKLLKSPLWEPRLAKYAGIFATRKEELKMAMSIHTTIGVDNANRSLGELSDKMDAMSAKMAQLFQNLYTSQEKEISKIIKDKGGLPACLQRDDVLESIISLSRSGEGPLVQATRGGSAQSKDSRELAMTRKELQEDLDKSLQENMKLFERKLDVQSRQLREQLDSDMHREGDRIINAFVLGQHVERLRDPDLRKIWKEMGWKGSVKSRYFVLSVRDYFVDKYRDADNQVIPPTPISVASQENENENSLTVFTGRGPVKQVDDRWALQYLTISHLQPLLEAFDDDSSGWVSIKEANAFALSKPKDWTLLQWLAYWAAGWHAIANEYNLKIKVILQQMNDILAKVLPPNRPMADQYLASWPITSVQLLSHSLRRSDVDVYQDPTLYELIHMYAAQEEKRIEENLNSVMYNIDASSTLTLVVGEGRIDRFIFPLLYLMLEHHLKIMKLACEGVFSGDNFYSAQASLYMVMDAVDQRIDDLIANCKQKNLDVDGQLGMVAFGMYNLLANSDKGLKLLPEHLPISYEPNVNEEKADPTILLFDFVDHELDISAYEHPVLEDFTELDVDATGFPHVAGAWAGLYFYEVNEESTDGLMEMSFDAPGEDGFFRGSGDDALDSFVIQGKLEKFVPSDGHSNAQDVWNVSFKKTYDHQRYEGSPVTWLYSGKLDIGSSTMKGYWGARDDPKMGTFRLSKVPVHVRRFRYSEKEYKENPGTARWKFACAAVLHHVRRQMWSWSYFEGRMRDRMQFVDLYQRREISKLWYLPSDYFSAEDEATLKALESGLMPPDTRYYRTLTKTVMRDYSVHSNASCDSCSITIIGSRIICLECKYENYRNQIDLCSSCMNMEVMNSHFVHERTHQQLKVRNVVHSIGKGGLMRMAKKAAERAVDLLRLRDEIEAIVRAKKELTNSKQRGGDEQEQEVKESYTPECMCYSCHEPVVAPCWYCVCCDTDVFVCDKCENDSLRKPGSQCNYYGSDCSNSSTPGHDDKHPLVRCQDQLPLAVGISGSITLDPTLHTRIIGLESIISSFDDRLARLENGLQDHNEKFALMESLLSRIVHKLAA